MDKFNLNRRVSELQVGDIFWFSGGLRVVTKIDNEDVWYNAWLEESNKTRLDKPQSIRRKSQMLVELKIIDNGKH